MNKKEALNALLLLLADKESRSFRLYGDRELYRGWKNLYNAKQYLLAQKVFGAEAIAILVHNKAIHIRFEAAEEES